jgi:hypothetical protein
MKVNKLKFEMRNSAVKIHIHPFILAVYIKGVTFSIFCINFKNLCILCTKFIVM